MLFLRANYLVRSDLSGRAKVVVAMGSAVAGAGFCMLGAWLFHMERIVRLVPGFLMVFNTALEFALVGTALVAGAIFPPARNALHTAAGLAIASLAALVLTQHLLGVSLGIDWPGLHLLLPETAGARMPGRMSPGTGVTFMLAAAVLFLAPRARSRVHAVLVRTFTLAIVCAMRGIWHATHSLPVDPSL